MKCHKTSCSCKRGKCTYSIGCHLAGERQGEKHHGCFSTPPDKFLPAVSLQTRGCLAPGGLCQPRLCKENQGRCSQHGCLCDKAQQHCTEGDHIEPKPEGKISGRQKVTAHPGKRPGQTPCSHSRSPGVFRPAAISIPHRAGGVVDFTTISY